jgi:hypothetical protein
MAGLRDGHALASAQFVTDAAERMRRARDVKHIEHTREVIKQELPDGARNALIMMAERIERLERVIASLAAEAQKADNEC